MVFFVIGKILPDITGIFPVFASNSHNIRNGLKDDLVVFEYLHPNILRAIKCGTMDNEIANVISGKSGFDEVNVWISLDCE